MHPTQVLRALLRFLDKLGAISIRFEGICSVQTSKNATNACPKSEVDGQRVRHVKEVALRTKKSAKEMKSHLYIPVIVRRKQQILGKTRFLCY